jgi:NAD(P)-dependent dehydrogenase (short-subunit alcohol dehydrogenase family)
MPRPIAEQVVVITGASSGIGLQTALELGRRKARVVLAARGAQQLERAASDVQRVGGQALSVTTDVAEWEQVQTLAERAVEAFGRIDTWVNGAAVSAYGLVEDLTVEEIRQVIEIDLLGHVHGVKAVLPHLRRQGEGAIIAIASVLGRRAVPLQAPYCAAKFGVVGFMDALRLELEHDRTGISVTTILPSSIDTPLFDHAASRLGVRPAPIPPIYKPGVVSEAILFAAEHPLPEIVVGGGGKALSVSERLAPRLTDRLLLLGGQAFKRQRSDRPIAGEGNLFTSGPANGSATGSVTRAALSRSLYTRHLEQRPMRKRVLLAAALGASLLAPLRANR